MTIFDCQRKILIERASRKRIGKYCGILFYTIDEWNTPAYKYYMQSMFKPCPVTVKVIYF